MLQDARPGNLPVLGHMPDQHQRRVTVFGEVNKLLAGDAHLADRAGRGLNGGRPHGLNGINHHQRNIADLFERFDNIRDIGFRRQFNIGI